MTDRDGKDNGALIEDTAESVLGLNFRSRRTLRDLFVRPAKVFAAYVAGDRVTYTPAVRIWLGLIGLQFLFSVFWGGYGEMYARNLKASDPETLALMEQTLNRPIGEIAEVFGQVTSFLFAPVIGALTALSVFVLSAFRNGLSWASRFHIAFGILSAGSVPGLLSLPLVGAWPQAATWAALAIFAVYIMTFYRGLRGILYATVIGGLVKAVIFCLCLLTIMVVGGVLLSMLTVLISAIWLSTG